MSSSDDFRWLKSSRSQYRSARFPPGRGEMLEWLNRLVSKTSELARVPRVRIPVSPPASRLNIKKIENLPKCPAVRGALRLACISVARSAYFGGFSALLPVRETLHFTQVLIETEFFSLRRHSKIQWQRNGGIITDENILTMRKKDECQSSV